MAFPGRPTMVPGIPLPSIPLPSYMPPMMPSVMAMPAVLQVPPYRPSGPSKYLHSQPKKNPPEGGPAITVFIGNIVEHAPDLMIRHILASCGQVLNWKRTHGFGFAEFGSPESALRAIRVLHDMMIGTKKLVLKVDANTTVVLNNYKKDQKRKQGKPIRNDDDVEDYVDDKTRQKDRNSQETVKQILSEFGEEMQKALIDKEEENKLKKEIIQNLPDKNRAQKSQDILTKLSAQTEAKNTLDTDDDGKRDLITREIGKFREIMKKQEAEREEERLRREERMKQERDRSSRSRSTSVFQSPKSPLSPVSKASTPEPRHRQKNRRRSHSRSRDRERDRDRDRERDRDRDRERERDREQPKEKVSKREVDRAQAKQREEEEEEKERKKQEKRTREKEVAYQERVRAWETRERRKRKEFEKEKDRKRGKEEAMEREAKKLKEFLEDYDDERDDIKFYKGRELARRIGERERERESDDKDRIKEKEEIEELRNKVLESDAADPTAIYQKLLQEHEDMYKPKIIIDVNAEQLVRMREREREKEERERLKAIEKEEIRLLEEERRRKEEELEEIKRAEAAAGNAEVSSDDDGGADFGPTSNHNSPSDNEEPPTTSPANVINNKKKKLDVKDVFNADEDEDSLPGAKKRKLVPLDYSEDKKGPKKKDHHKKDEKKGDENSKCTEEKRKNIKSLIEKIPTDKSALFDFVIDWDAVDNQLMERRIRPWINKKIIEYIGEPEPTLVDFICSKVMAGSAPQGILDDVQMVLDEEAEVFVVKMWRLLIYEIEAKKLGLVK